MEKVRGCSLQVFEEARAADFVETVEKDGDAAFAQQRKEAIFKRPVSASPGLIVVAMALLKSKCSSWLCAC
jgi:hypothetical protein